MAVSIMIDRGPPPGYIGAFVKPGIIPANKAELNKYGLKPYHCSKEFRTKMASQYVPVLEKQLEE